MTWKDVKLAVLQKMFSADGITINENDESVREYMNAMPQAANEGLQLLCTAGKALRRCYEIPDKGAGVMTVDLTRELTDFYRADRLEVYGFDESGTPCPVTGAQLVGGRFLVLPDGVQGRVLFYYDAWPPDITLTTPDDEEIPLDPDAAVILPLYIASQLYKDDDIAIATVYRNEFEVAFGLLKQPCSGVTSDEFTSVSGWI